MPCPLDSPERPGYPLHRGAASALEPSGRSKYVISCPCRDSNTWPSSPYPSRYTDYSHLANRNRNREITDNLSLFNTFRQLHAREIAFFNEHTCLLDLSKPIYPIYMPHKYCLLLNVSSLKYSYFLSLPPPPPYTYRSSSFWYPWFNFFSGGTAIRVWSKYSGSTLDTNLDNWLLNDPEGSSCQLLRGGRLKSRMSIRDCRLPPRRKWFTDVSGKRIGSIFKDQAVLLQVWTVYLSRNVGK